MPMPKLMSVYGSVGRVTPSATGSRGVAVAPVRLRLRISSSLPHISYSSQVISYLPIQKGSRSDLVLGAFVLLMSSFRFGAAHQKLAAWDGNHFDFDIGMFDHFGIWLHLRGIGRFGRGKFET